MGGLFVVLVAAGWWYLWVPNWRPPLQRGERYGIDVSAHQGLIDWDRVAGDSIEFAYIKATEGGDFVDDRFAQNWAGAAEAGLDRGAYHFFTLCTAGEQQAENFLDVAPPEPEALPPAVDLELAGNCSERPSTAAVNAELVAFLDAIESAWGRDVILYLGNDFESAYEVQDTLDRPLWLRRFFARPDEDDWLIWQIHGYANVEGVDGDTDLDVMRDEVEV